MRTQPHQDNQQQAQMKLISFPDLSWTKPKAGSGQIRFAPRDRLSGMWQARQERMPKINFQNGGTGRLRRLTQALDFIG